MFGLCAVLLLVLSRCGGGTSEPPPPPPGAIAAGQSIGSAAVHGNVEFRGDPPPRKPINMSGEAACRKGKDGALSEEIIVANDGALRNVHVRVVSGLGDRVFAPPAEAIAMDQRGCVFDPHVLSAQVNQIISFTSSDPVLHNVRAVARKNATFNVSMSGRGRSIRRFFSHPEIVRIRCDIHAWMAAYVVVSEHPFHAVSGNDGAFAIEGLPAGTYEIEAWHEALGTSRQSVTLTDGERR